MDAWQPPDPAVELPGAVPMEARSGYGAIGLGLSPLDEVRLEGRGSWAPWRQIRFDLRAEVAIWDTHDASILNPDPGGALDQRILVGVRANAVEREWGSIGGFARVGEWFGSPVGDLGLVAEGGFPWLRLDVSLPLGFALFPPDQDPILLLAPWAWVYEVDAGLSGRLGRGQSLRLGVTGGTPWLSLGWSGKFGDTWLRVDAWGDPWFITGEPQITEVRVMVGESF